jgi:hypothetical protein
MKVTFGRVLAAEWTKFWAVRATSRTLAGLPVVAPQFAWLFSAGGGRDYAGLSSTEKAKFDPTAISLQNHLMAQPRRQPHDDRRPQPRHAHPWEGLALFSAVVALISAAAVATFRNRDI